MAEKLSSINRKNIIDFGKIMELSYYNGALAALDQVLKKTSKKEVKELITIYEGFKSGVYEENHIVTARE